MFRENEHALSCSAGPDDTHCAIADQGNLQLLKLICASAEGRTFHGVNDGASKSQAPLMRACTHGCALLPVPKHYALQGFCLRMQWM